MIMMEEESLNGAVNGSHQRSVAMAGTTEDISASLSHSSVPASHAIPITTEGYQRTSSVGEPSSAETFFRQDIDDDDDIVVSSFEDFGEISAVDMPESGFYSLGEGGSNGNRRLAGRQEDDRKASNNGHSSSTVEAASSKLSRAGQNLSSYLGRKFASKSDNPKPTSATTSATAASTSNMFDTDSVKDKFKSAWNNVKYGWQLKSAASFDHEVPIWLLGKIYHPPPIDHGSSSAMDQADFRDFLADYRSRLWFTYRSGFPVFADTSTSTDCGWGCMLRSVQMMTAQALIVRHLGRDWKWYQTNTTTEKMHRRIIALFGDSPHCDLSLHAMMAVARAKQMPGPVGKWFAPSTAAALMRDTLSLSSDPLLTDISMLVATDCCLAKSDVIEASAKWTKSLIIVICLRLGAEKVNRCYHRHIRTLMSMRSCIGIVGGRPKHSVYFVGSYHKHLIFLDPHLVQDTVPVDSNTEFPLKTFHCRLPGKLSLTDMDPSCAIGFFVQSENEFQRMIGDLSEFQVIELEDDRRKGIIKQDPLFTLVDERQGRFEGSEDAKDATLVAQARQHGFELL